MRVKPINLKASIEASLQDLTDRYAVAHRFSPTNSKTLDLEKKISHRLALLEFSAASLASPSKVEAA